jgi:triacylglycerol lipase
MSYKSSTIALAVILVATYVTLITVMMVVILPQLRFSQTLGKAVQHAAGNNTMCDRVQCDFVPDASVRAPATADVVSAAGKYHLPTARFAAQQVALLEDASLKAQAPIPPPGVNVLGVVSGTKAGEAARMQNMAWVLQPVDQPDQLWLAFRGTQTKAEWKIDLDMELVPWSDAHPEVLVHRGFYTAALELMPSITELLQTRLTPQTQLFITGHSLGASLALLSTMMLAAAGVRSMHTYVFAPPRVGNDKLVSAQLALTQPTQPTQQPVVSMHAIANVADIIPQLPLSVQPNLVTPTTPLLYAQLPLLMFQDNWGSWVHNHIMPVYIANLAKLSFVQPVV